MLLQVGEKILVVHRRLFEEDRSRFFVGEIEDWEAGVAKARGYTWLVDETRGACVRKDDIRTKIISLASGTLIVYHLPKKIALQSLELTFDDHGQMLLTDHEDLRMDLGEYPRPAKN